MKRQEFLNQSEQRTLALLERVLEGQGRKVYVGPRLQRIVRDEPDDNLNAEEQRMLRHGEVDFAVVNTEGGYNVEFAVEFDGPHHEGPEQAKRDRIKDRLLLRGGIPLIRVPGRAISEREQMTILEWVAECFLTWKRDQAAVEAQAMELVEENPDINPLAVMGIALFGVVPFRPRREVAERLRNRYGVQYGFRPPGLNDDEDQTEARLKEWLEARYSIGHINPVGEFAPEDPRDEDEQLVAAQAAMLRGKPGDVPDFYRMAVLERLGDGEFDTAFITEVPIQWPARQGSVGPGSTPSGTPAPPCSLSEARTRSRSSVGSATMPRASRSTPTPTCSTMGWARRSVSTPS